MLRVGLETDLTSCKRVSDFAALESGGRLVPVACKAPEASQVPWPGGGKLQRKRGLQPSSLA